MKNNKKVILISSIILLLSVLLVIGLTYAYYRTRVVGNDNVESIRAQGKKIEVTYQNESAFIEATDAEPGSVYTKTFEVKNTGSQTVEYGVKLENITNTMIRTEDFVYELYIVSNDGSESLVSSDEVPTIDTYIQGRQSIESEQVVNYKIVVKYLYLDDVNQSDDMGAKIAFRINIDDPTGNAELFKNANEGTLLAAIGNHNLIENPETIPGVKVSTDTEAVLSATDDNYGTSYYFRGNVVNNYVNFAGMCWKIVRVNGNGSIKLIMEDAYAECNSDDYTGNFITGNANYGFEKVTSESNGTIYKHAFLNPVTLKNASLSVHFQNYQTLLAQKIDSSSTDINLTLSSKLISGDWCLDNRGYASDVTNLDDAVELNSEQINTLYNTTGGLIHYGAFLRLQQNTSPSLKCDLNEVDNFQDGTAMYVGTITADELVFAGLKPGGGVLNNYLFNEYQKTNAPLWTSLSLGRFRNQYDYTYRLNVANGLLSLNLAKVSTSFAVRPSVNLKSDITVTKGNGSIRNPYIVR